MGCCKSRRRWLEPGVDYAPDFREAQKVLGQSYECPYGHLMDEFVTQAAGYLRCDVCGKPQELGRRMQGCWDCDYHVCQQCTRKFEDTEWYSSWFRFWRGSKPKPSVEDSTASTAVPCKAPRCPGSHTMCQYFSSREPRVQCDVCGRKLAPYVRTWGCSECNYDVGPCCESHFEDPNFMSQWRAYWNVKEDAEAVDADLEAPLPAPESPPSSSGLSSVPDITRPKPQALDVAKELQQHEESQKAKMVLGGKNEVVAPALMTAVLGGPQKGAEGGAQAPEVVMNFVKKGRKTVEKGGRKSKTSKERPLETLEGPEEAVSELVEDVARPEEPAAGGQVEEEPLELPEGTEQAAPEPEQLEQSQADGEKRKKKKRKEEKEKSEKKEKKQKKEEKDGEEKERRRTKKTEIRLQMPQEA